MGGPFHALVSFLSFPSGPGRAINKDEAIRSVEGYLVPDSGPIPPQDLECYRDADWALHDPDVQRTYAGQWVVAYQRRVIASGKDVRAVAEQAARLAAGHVHRVVYCAPEEPDRWLGHEADMGAEFPDA